MPPGTTVTVGLQGLRRMPPVASVAFGLRGVWVISRAEGGHGAFGHRQVRQMGHPKKEGAWHMGHGHGTCPIKNESNSNKGACE